MKFKFEDTRYWKLWESQERTPILQEFLDKALIGVNYGFHTTQFRPDTAITPRQSDGTATFTSTMREIKGGNVLNMRAPLGDAYVRDKEGVARYSAPIPDFIADAYVETANEREYKEKMFAEYGNDKQLLLNFADEVQNMINEADQTMNYMAAQALSTGSVNYNIGVGLKNFIYESPIPAENKIKAGKQAWSVTSFKLLDRMREIEDSFYQKWGKKIPMKWQIPYKMFHEVFLKNEQVIEWVRYVKTTNNVLLPESLVVTTEMFNEAITRFEGISPIEVIVEKENNYSVDVQGWDAKIAVFRPAGYAGVIRYSDILDKAMHEKYGVSAITRTFARVGVGGIYTLVNSVLPNGNYKEWHTDLMVAAVPSLDEFLYHVLVDTTSAE